MKIERLWKPCNTPWRAIKSGTETRVWYTILDVFGNELMTTERAHVSDDRQVLSEVAFILCMANKSRTITVNNNQIEIQWFGEANDGNGNDESGPAGVEIPMGDVHVAGGYAETAGGNPKGFNETSAGGNKR